MTSSNSNSTRFSIDDACDDAWSENTSIQQAENDNNDNNDVMVAGIPIQFFVGTTAQEVAQDWLMSSARARIALETADKKVFEAARKAQQEEQKNKLALAEKNKKQQEIQKQQDYLVECFRQGGLDLETLSQEGIQILEEGLQGRELREFRSELLQLDLLKKVQETETALLNIAKTSKRIEDNTDSNKLMTKLLLRLPALHEEAKRLSKNRIGRLNDERYSQYLQVLEKYQAEFLKGNPDIPGTLAEFIIWFNAQAGDRLKIHYPNENWVKKAIQAAGGILIDEEKIHGFAQEHRKF
jgi:hypothetical protein